MNTGHWCLEESVTITEQTFGFIYEITNNITGKKYIGKKQCFKKIKKAPLKNRRRKRVEQKVSDWMQYTGSSNELNGDIQLHGKDNFTFKIIKTCESKWCLAYEEIKEQIKRDVLLRDDYYNGIINVRIGTPPRQLLESYARSNK